MSLVISPKTGNIIKVGSGEFSKLIKDPKYRDYFQDPERFKVPKGKVVESGTPPMKNLPELPNSPNSSLKEIPLKANSKSPLNHRNSPSSNEKDKHLQAILRMPFLDIPTLEQTLKKTKQPAKREELQKMIEEKKYKEERGLKTRGWSARSPTRGKERHKLKADCGDRCFLLPEDEKFPICASPRITGTSVCAIDCGGVQAAKIRAAQHKYPEVEKKADAILKKCNASGKKRFLPTPPRSPAA